jgi:ion channel-forming bestrophin family protein
MYIGKRFPFWGTVNWSKKYILIFFLIDMVPILLFKIWNWQWLAIPWQPIALIGIAVSFYLGFKNNSSYDRLWEARKIWGGIVNASRTFTIMSRDFITNEHAKEKLSENDLNTIHKSIVHRHIAWLKALTFQLRLPKPWEHSDNSENELRKAGDVHYDDDHFEKLKPYLTSGEYEYLMTKGNKASHLLSLQSKELLKLKFAGLIEDFRHMELEKMLSEFFALQGKSERIKNFPFPRQYATVNYIFVWIFLVLLPFGMLNIFIGSQNVYSSWLVLPFTMLVSWVFILMEMIGDYSENPFEGLYNDVPISSMTRDIEIDIRQMLDEKDLPKPLEPIGIYRILL